MNQSSPLTLQDATHRDSAWERATNYEKEERPIRPVRKIVVKGAVDVVFFRSPSAHLVVAGETQQAIRSTKTYFEGDKLIIEQEGVFISGSGGSIHVSGSGNIFVGGTINVGGRQGGVTMQFKGRCIVGIALPEAPSIRIKGSGYVTLYDLSRPSSISAFRARGTSRPLAAWIFWTPRWPVRAMWTPVNWWLRPPNCRWPVLATS